MSDLSLTCSRLFKCKPDIVWRGIESGAFFDFTKPIKENTRLEFKEGGSYHMEWTDCGSTIEGEFLQVIPNQK